MKWVIEGADRDTGVKTSFTIDAESRNDAEVQARRRNVIISKCEPDGPPRLQPTARRVRDGLSGIGGMIQESEQRSPLGVPQYRPVIAAARVVNAGGMILIVLGCIGFVVAIVWLLFAAYANSRPVEHTLDPQYVAPARYSLTLAGTFLVECWWAVVTGGMLRLAAFVSLMIRDIARNSFRRE